MKLVKSITVPTNRKMHFKFMSNAPELPLLKKPCHDCAITTGFYTPIADELLKEDKKVQEDVLKRWHCHNHCNSACRGARNYVNSINKRKELMK